LRPPSRSAPCLAALLLAAAAPAGAAEGEESTRRLDLDLDFALANINDDALRWSLGRERQTKLPYAIVGLAGELGRHVSFRLELNAVNESVKPEPFAPSEKTPFFFPNQPDPAYGVTSKPEGQFKVDDYKNTGWDPYIQESNLRRGFVDVHSADGRLGLVVGRFFVPQGLPLEESRWFTSKDLTHIELINAATDHGAEAYYRFGSQDGFRGRASAAVISGNGDPYHDYVYFDFTRASVEDTNSAVGGVGALRLWPARGLELIGTYKYNFVGSRIETDITLQRSKHYDDALTAGFKYRPAFFERLQLFGQWARYKWGLRDTSAELLAEAPSISPVYKQGYDVGLELSVPLPKKKGQAGVIVVREELDRDDALVALLSDAGELGVRLGENERMTVLKLFAELGPLTAFFFHSFVDNPFPQVSAVVPISGPFAFQGPGSDKTGVGFRLRTAFPLR
jgi:hypothetical protein